MSFNLSNTVMDINKIHQQFLGVTISSNNIYGCLHLSLVSDMVSWHYGMFSSTTSAKANSFDSFFTMDSSSKKDLLNFIEYIILVLQCI